MELRKAYIDCETKKTDREIQKETDRKQKGEITEEEHKKRIAWLNRELQSKILQLIP